MNKNKLAILICIPLLLLLQSSTKKETPKICFEKVVHDFGRIQQNDPAICRFNFKNCGEGVLCVHYVKTTCGCTDAHSNKRSYKPDETGFIEVSYDSHRVGNIGKIIFVATNTPEKQKVALRITGEVVIRSGQGHV